MTNTKQTTNDASAGSATEEIIEQTDASTGSVTEENTEDTTGSATVEEEANSIEKELAEMQDKHIRLHAEFDNFRRRTAKEKIELMKNGGEKVLTDLLPVIDDFERAMQAMETSNDVVALKEGLQLIYTKFQAYLKQNGVQEIETQAQDFDTDKHEAITKIPAPSKDLKGKIVDVIQKGYQLNDKVIRFAKVVIGE
ncbi:MAG: nucleotide exchange factor GrpE [Bacteroidetes bacterium]|nr:nucleotide exchange factor GrpE [Bacteroidota bacterium]